MGAPPEPPVLVKPAAADGADGRSSGQFAVHFTLDVTPKATGRRVKLEEVGFYTVKDDRIVREQFYYDGDRWAEGGVLNPGAGEA